jgi:hypothetical protein
MTSRQHHSHLVSARAGCDRCTFTANKSNAQALAAKHTDKSGHPTWVEITNRISYGRAATAGAGSQASML